MCFVYFTAKLLDSQTLNITILLMSISAVQ
jgi:hypothetical protein